MEFTVFKATSVKMFVNECNAVDLPTWEGQGEADKVKLILTCENS